jgi:hypothetical protein
MSTNTIIILIFHCHKFLEQRTHFEKCLLHWSVVVHVPLLFRQLKNIIMSRVRGTCDEMTGSSSDDWIY